MASRGYNVLSRSEEATVKELDKDCKNKFKFQWLEEIVHVVSKSHGVDCKVKIGDSIVKINVSGKASCEWCKSILSYKGKGLGSLKEHLKCDSHIHQIKTRQSNYGLGSFVNTTSASSNVFPMFRTLSKPSLPSQPQPQSDQQSTETAQPEVAKPVVMIPLADRIATMEAMVLSTMTEHAIPFNLAPVIVDLAKACSSDPQALAGVRLGYSSAAYKIRFGLAKTVTQELVAELRSNYFSLNIDEATCSNTKKVLSILVNFMRNGKITTHHLASVEINRADAATIYSAVCDIFDQYQLPWKNLISILSDSCAVMRGRLSGVETRIRTEKAPHLLDIDGDTCHHMQIIAKAFCAPFGGKLETLFKNLFTDFKWCSEYKMYLSEICSILKIPYSMPQMYSGTRWLSCYDRALDTLALMDSYLLFYFSFLNESDRDIYWSEMKGVLETHEVDAAGRKRLYQIMEILSGKSGTKEGKMRKASIIKSLFYTSDDTILQLELFSTVLTIFKEYVCVFQSKTPMAHKLHDMQVAAVKKFLSLFMRPEHIPVKLTDAKVCDKSCHLPQEDIFIGHSELKTPQNFIEKVVEGYTSASEIMFEKLPIYNKTLMAFSALDPRLTGHTVVQRHLKKLGKSHLSHILTTEEQKVYKTEVRAYVNDSELPPPRDNVDQWWSQETIMQKYPVLGRVALAAFTVFHGPQVESTFSEMSRILNKQTNRLSIPMLSAIQTVKYELKVNNTTSLVHFKRKNPKTDTISPLLCRNIRTAFTAYETDRKHKQAAAELKNKILQKAQTSKQTVAGSAAIKKTALKRTRKTHMKDHIKTISKKYNKPPAKKIRLE